MSVLLELSRALSVPLQQLVDLSDGRGAAPYQVLSELRACLNSSTSLLVVDDLPRLDIPGLAREASNLRAAYNRGHAFAGRAPWLAAVTGRAQVALAEGGPQRAAAAAALANLYRLASLALRQHGDLALARVAVDRALLVAERADDEDLLASVAATLSVQLMMQGDPEQAVAVALSAVRLIGRTGSTSTMTTSALRGALYLYAAQAAARARDEGEALRLLAEAQTLAGALGRDGEFHCVLFGPTNVGIQAAAIMVDLNRPEDALQAARGVQAEVLGSVARTAYHHLHIARAQASLGRDGAAVQSIARAERASAELTRNDALARELVRSMARRRRTLNEPLRRLTVSMDVLN